MTRDSFTRRLVAVQSEMRAQKIACGVNFGQLRRGAPKKTATWQGGVGMQMNTTHGVSARWIIRFTRTDGVMQPPMAQMAYDFTLGLTAAEDMRRAGFYTSYEVKDAGADDEYRFESGVLNAGENWLEWWISAGQGWFYQSVQEVNVRIDVSVISMVDGVVKIRRDI